MHYWTLSGQLTKYECESTFNKYNKLVETDEGVMVYIEKNLLIRGEINT